MGAENPQVAGLGNGLVGRRRHFVGVALAIAFGLIAGYRHVLVLGTLVAGAGLLAQVTADVLSVPLQAQLLLGRLTGRATLDNVCSSR